MEVEIKKSLEHINIPYIDKKGAVKLIKFSDDFDMWTCERKIEYLSALASSLNHSAETAYKERDEMAVKFEQVLKLNEAAAMKAGQSTMLMEQMATQLNSDKKELHDRIAELKQEIREKEALIKELSGVE